MSIAERLCWVIEGDYDYSSTQVNLDQEMAKRIIQWGKENIPDAAIYEEEDSYGREDTPHITILYGILSQSPDETREVLEEEDMLIATLGKVSLFENSDDYDVVKIEVNSEDLSRVNASLRDSVDFESDYPEYDPHVTIAYVKKGEGKNYSGSNEFEGSVLNFDEVRFSSKDETITMIPLQRKIAAGLHWRG
jgi:2'-5' RNA ligase